jgi:hypothetical protein
MQQILQQIEKRYDAENDRLFLVYYVLPKWYNQNKWRVTDRLYDENIKTGINKPVIIMPKQHGNPFHARQATNFVHPTIEEALSELGQSSITEQQYYDWQGTKGVVGRIHDIEKRDKGHAWTLEITEPVAKKILISDEYKTGFPGYTSPQILVFPNKFRNEAATESWDHWVISHVILTDNPAFGIEQSSIAGKCIGSEQECMIKTRSACTCKDEQLAIRQATIDLVNFSKDNLSSQVSTSSSDSLEMSANDSKTPDSNNNQNQSFNVNKTLSEQGEKQEPNSLTPPPQGSGENSESNFNESHQPPKEEGEQANLPRTLEEAHALIRDLMNQNKTKDEYMKSFAKEQKDTRKQLEQIQMERKQFKLMSMIPRDLFKSDEAYMKEVNRVMVNNLSDEFIIDYYDSKRKNIEYERNSKQTPQIAARSASTSTSLESSNDDDEKLSSNLQKTLELQRRILEGGR